MRSIEILGTRVDDVTYGDSVALVERAIRERGPHAIVTPNPEIVLLARRDAQLQAVLARAALAIPDGIGLLLAARLRGRPLRQHVRGTDLVHQLAQHGVARGWRWFLLGAEQGVALEAGRAVERAYPGFKLAGAGPGSPHEQDDEWVREQISASGPVDVLLVAYGAPLQERWLDRNLGPLDIPVGIGVGGVLNFFAGRVPRAPGWVRWLELEFAYRLIVEPWRWRRQLALPRFAILAVAEAARLRFAGSSRRGL